MKIIIYDTEFTTWEGTMEANWSREGEAREIVQFSAIKLDIGKSLSRLDEFDVLVKPQKNPLLSDYFSNLTGISQQQVDANGIANVEMLERLKTYSDGGSIPIFSWGNDFPSIQDTAKECDITVDWVNSYDIRGVFTQAGYDVAGFNSGNLFKLFELDLDIQQHNAMDDVKSLVASIEYVFQKQPQVIRTFFQFSD